MYYILSWMCYSITIQYSPLTLTLTFVPHHRPPNPPQQLKAIQQRPRKRATAKRNDDNKRDRRKKRHIVLEINETVNNFQRSNHWPLWSQRRHFWPNHLLRSARNVMNQSSWSWCWHNSFINVIRIGFAGWLLPCYLFWLSPPTHIQNSHVSLE